jgi:hypothetical protein
MAEMNPLRCRMIRNLWPVTQRCYVHAVAKNRQALQPPARSARLGRGAGLPDPPAV